MKIIFVYPAYESLGIEYLSAVLKKNGHQTELAFDPCLFNDDGLYSKYLEGLFSFKGQMIDKIVRSSPGLVCFSCVSDRYPWACEIARGIKEKIKVPIVFGGIHPTSVPEKVIKNEFVDFIITGEGEGALADLVQKLENQDSDFRINNLWSKKDGQVIANEPRGLIQDLDSLPFPDKNLYSGEFTDFHKQYSIITSRGCPFSCTYCSNSYLKEFYRGKGEFLRFRSVENVIKELKLAKERYKMGSVLFFDEELFSDSNRAKRLLSLYKKEIGLPFWCYINPQIMDEEKIALLEESGCNSVEMGVQDTDADINKNILKRKIDLGHLKKVIRGLRKAKISIFNDIILGLPTQKEHNLIETVSFFNENRIDHPMLYWLRYYPRTEIVGIAMKEGALSPDKYEMLEGASCSFFIGGSTYNPRIARIANLFYLCCILPGWLMSLIIRKKAYRYFPPLSLRFYLDEVIAVKRYFLQLLGLKKKRIYFAGKTPVYLHYFFKWLTIR